MHHITNGKASFLRWINNPMAAMQLTKNKRGAKQTRRAAFETLENRVLMSITPTTDDLQQYMLELVNLARSSPSTYATSVGIDLNEGLTAGTITSAPKQPLAPNPELINGSIGHSQWMINNDIFSHNETLNSTILNTPFQRMVLAGYDFTGSYSYAENIGEAGTTGTLNQTLFTHDVEQNLFVDAGISGRGHRINLMNPNLREIGVGIVVGQFQGYNTVMATQDFAASGTNVFLTGVAYDDSLVTKDNFYTPGEGLTGATITAFNINNSSLSYQTTTLPGGGYALALPAGTYNVQASGGGLAKPIYHSNVVIGSLNVKVDFVPTATTITNHTPTYLVLSPYTIPENQPSGSTVGTFTTIDPDVGNTFTYSLVTGTGSTDNSSFSIVNNELHTAIPLDYATKNSYSIRVQTMDQGGLTFEKSFTIAVTKSNHLPVVTSFTKNVNQDTKTNITSVDLYPNFSDPDVGDKLVKIKITALPTHGTLKLGDTAVTLNQEIGSSTAGALNYTPDSGYTGTDSFDYQGSDGKNYSLASATVTLAIHPLPTLTISDAAPVLEGTPNVPAIGQTQRYYADFTVTLSETSLASVSVYYSVANGVVAPNDTTVKAGKAVIDFASVKGQLTFLPGETVKHIMVPITPNAIVELDKVFNVMLLHPTNALLANTTGAGKILNDDQPLVTITATGAPTENLPGNKGKNVITIARSVPLPTPLTVTLVTTGTATNGLDYDQIPSTVTIPAGAYSVTIPFQTIDDQIAEPTEVAYITAAPDPSYRTELKRSTARLTIVDNEPTVSIIKYKDANEVNLNNTGVGRFMVMLDHISSAPVTVKYSVSGTATPGNIGDVGADYQSLTGSVTIDAGRLSALIYVVPFTDSAVEGKETVVLTLVQDSTPSYLLASLASRRIAYVVILDKKV